VYQLVFFFGLASLVSLSLEVELTAPC